MSAFTLVQTSTVSTGTATITSSAAGNLLVVLLSCTTSIPSAPTGFTLRISDNSTTNAMTAIYDYIDNPGGITSVTVSGTSLAFLVQEWQPPASSTVTADQEGSIGTASVSGTQTVSTSSALTGDDDCAVAVFRSSYSRSESDTMSVSSPFINAANLNNGVSNAAHAVFGYNGDTGVSGSVLSCTGNNNVTTRGNGSSASMVAYNFTAVAPVQYDVTLDTSLVMAAGRSGGNPNNHSINIIFGNNNQL